jgi:hypothetical protein
MVKKITFFSKDLKFKDLYRVFKKLFLKLKKRFKRKKSRREIVKSHKNILFLSVVKRIMRQKKLRKENFLENIKKIRNVVSRIHTSIKRISKTILGTADVFKNIKELYKLKYENTFKDINKLYFKKKHLIAKRRIKGRKQLRRLFKKPLRRRVFYYFKKLVYESGRTIRKFKKGKVGRVKFIFKGKRKKKSFFITKTIKHGLFLRRFIRLKPKHRRCVRFGFSKKPAVRRL